MPSIFILCRASYRCKYKSTELNKILQFIFHSSNTRMHLILTWRTETLHKTNSVVFIILTVTDILLTCSIFILFMSKERLNRKGFMDCPIFLFPYVIIFSWSGWGINKCFDFTCFDFLLNSYTLWVHQNSVYLRQCECCLWMGSKDHSWLAHCTYLLCSHTLTHTCMLHCPTGYKAHKIQAQRKTLKISRWWQQRFKQSKGPSECGTLCKYMGHMPMKPALMVT